MLAALRVTTCLATQACVETSNAQAKRRCGSLTDCTTEPAREDLVKAPTTASDSMALHLYVVGHT